MVPRIASTPQPFPVELMPCAGAASSARSSETSLLKRSGMTMLLFLIGAILAQLALLTPLGNVFRVPLRAFPFVVSLVLLVSVVRQHSMRLHSANIALAIALFIVGLGIFHPARNTITSAISTTAMYLAIASPLFWSGRLLVDQTWFRRVVIVLWSFSMASSLLGCAQTLWPDKTWLQPNLSQVVQNYNDGGEGLKISLASGAKVFRPMGLSDQPGGAAMSGMFCVVFGVVLFVSARQTWLRAACVVSWGLGVYCILLSQVRSVLVMTLFCIIAFVFAMARRGEFARLTRVLTLLAASVTVSFVAAFAVGGETVSDRLTTLVSEDPASVYLNNRGFFLEYTVKYAFRRWPLGAGLGRWGMMNYYFGTQVDPDSESLYSEIMWTGWTYDGGLPLIVAYVTAIGIALWQAWNIARDRSNGDLGLWAAAVFAFDLGCLALTFNCNLFMSQTGLEFWLVNGALFAAAQYDRAKRLSHQIPSSAEQTSPLPRSLLSMQS